MSKPVRRVILKKPETFADLERAHKVTVQNLKIILREYANSGLAISGRAVNSLIDRVKFTKQDLRELILIAERGKLQTQGIVKSEYQLVINYLGKMLSVIAQLTRDA